MFKVLTASHSATLVDSPFSVGSSKEFSLSPVETVLKPGLLISFAGSLVIALGSRIASRSIWGRLSNAVRRSALAYLASETSFATT